MTPTQPGVIVMTDKKWTKEEVKAKLESDDKWLVRGLLAIHARQTEEEKTTETTKEQNGTGFNSVDANILTDLVNQYKRTNGYLSVRQIALIRKKMVKYAGQLTRIANKEV
jgi:hypothetical protein